MGVRYNFSCLFSVHESKVHLRPPIPSPGGPGCCPFQDGVSTVVDLLFYVPPIVCGGSCLSLFWYTSLYVISSIAIILTRKRELVALLLLHFGCPATANVL